MKVKIKRLDFNAEVPAYANPGDAGLDLTAVSVTTETNAAGVDLMVYGTGLAVEIPEGYVGLLFPRSSISKKGLRLANSVGVIDSGYLGEIMFKFAITSDRPRKNSVYEVGDRIGQLIIMPYPKIEFVTGELTESERGVGGFGSTGV